MASISQSGQPPKRYGLLAHGAAAVALTLFVAGILLGAVSVIKVVPGDSEKKGDLGALGEGGLALGEEGEVEEVVLDAEGNVISRRRVGVGADGSLASSESGTAGRAAGRSGAGAGVGAGGRGSGGAGTGGGGTGGGSSGGGVSGALSCGSNNGGATAPGVTASEIKIAAGIVTTGVGSGFLGEAHLGIKAALAGSGIICGRTIPSPKFLNTRWEQDDGKRAIADWKASGNIFALVAQPDSEGLHAASGDLINHPTDPFPVVGTDGLLKSQYNNPWIWPVATSTASNMHIIVRYAQEKLGASQASHFAIVFDTRYKFGPEGARALNGEVKRLFGGDIPGSGSDACQEGVGDQYCGVSADDASGGYSTQRGVINNACTPCKIVVMLLEPTPMLSWMSQQGSSRSWYQHLFGGEPLFNDNVGHNCPGCGGMTVWTGFRPALQPFDAEDAVASFCGRLQAQGGKDCHNVFTEGAYVGTKAFIEAVKRVCNPSSCKALTRANLRDALNSGTYDFGLTAQPLAFGTTLPRVANRWMAAYQDNYSGSFNGWSYLSTGFREDPSATQDL